MPSALNYDGGLTISFQVGNLARTIAWYRDVLGLTFLYEAKEVGWCEFATETAGGRVNFGFSQVESPKVGAGPVPTLGVKSIEAARASLERHKVRFDGPTQTIPGLVMLATFFDPDGNALMLYQSLAPAGGH